MGKTRRVSAANGRQRTPLRRLLKDKAKRENPACCRQGIKGQWCACDRWANNPQRCTCEHRPTQHRRVYRVVACTECDCRFINPGQKCNRRFVAKIAKHAARVDRHIAFRDKVGRNSTFSPYKV